MIETVLGESVTDGPKNKPPIKTTASMIMYPLDGNHPVSDINSAKSIIFSLSIYSCTGHRAMHNRVR